MAERNLSLLLSVILLAFNFTSIVAAPVNTVPGLPVGPPGASGSIIGSAAFQGTDGNPVDPSDSAFVSDYQLVAGQSQDSDDGLYLDFTSIPNPQPIRGTGGGTDPGPRMLSFSSLCSIEFCL